MQRKCYHGYTFTLLYVSKLKQYHHCTVLMGAMQCYKSHFCFKFVNRCYIAKNEMAQFHFVESYSTENTLSKCVHICASCSHRSLYVTKTWDTISYVSVLIKSTVCQESEQIVGLLRHGLDITDSVSQVITAWTVTNMPLHELKGELLCTALSSDERDTCRDSY